MKFVRIQLFIIIIIFSGCATLGRDFKYTDKKKLRINETSKSQLFNFFGHPQKIETESTSELDSIIYHWYYRAGKTTRYLNVEVVNETVRAYASYSSFSEDSSFFNSKKRSKIKKKSTKKHEVLRLFGSPSGYAMFPSNLIGLKDELKGKTYEAWYYLFIGYVSNDSNRVYIKKYLNVYFDKKGLVLDHFYSENVIPD
ncbi:MAG: hypothetical protein KAS64_06675 [Spirochaetes bacterium]|nr:hypothetical protein [Spirochaetota bacterium]